jgi:exonuclease III
MRVASWNLNHRARQRSIPEWVVPEVALANPDVLVCTEYVEGSRHEDFVSQLRDLGFSAVTTSPMTPGQNQILIASRAPHQRGTLEAPRDIDQSVPSNALHVIVDGINILGFRMPAFDSKARDLKRRTWNWIREAAVELKEAPALIIGDMNTQRGDPKTYCGDCIDDVLAIGWSEIIPAAGYSWKHHSGTGRRIDFGFASSALMASSVEYSWDFVARNGIQKPVEGSPDHAMLIADLRQSPTARSDAWTR